jgi:hypothetical protein
MIVLTVDQQLDMSSGIGWMIAWNRVKKWQKAEKVSKTEEHRLPKDIEKSDHHSVDI